MYAIALAVGAVLASWVLVFRLTVLDGMEEECGIWPALGGVGELLFPLLLVEWGKCMV